MTRRICVVTGSRADYGHLEPVMRAIKADPELELRIVACGQHFDARFGETWNAIAQDGFKIDASVDVHLGNSRLEAAEAVGKTLSALAPVLAKLSPDIVLVLGDRYEIFAAGAAALLLGIPLAHIHGGELTEAAMDDALRHALSKMASLHFAAAKSYGQRLIQMGEEPSRVIVSGAPGLDQVAALAPFSKEEMAARLGIVIRDPLLLITYHPVTTHKDSGLGAAKALLEALDAQGPATMIFTGVNSDPGHDEIQKAFMAYVAAAPQQRLAVPSLGQRGYLRTMRLAAAVIGNSSSGLIEAPALGVPTVNIGDRQKGRLRSPSVIDCAEDMVSIRAAIAKAIDPVFRAKAARVTPAYGRGGASARIVATLKSVPLAQLSVKRFHDILPPREG